MTHSAASSFADCSAARWGHTCASDYTCSRNEGDAESGMVGIWGNSISGFKGHHPALWEG